MDQKKEMDKKKYRKKKRRKKKSSKERRKRGIKIGRKSVERKKKNKAGS